MKILGLAALLAVLAACGTPSPSPADLPVPTTQPTTVVATPTATFQSAPIYPVAAGDKDAALPVAPRSKVKPRLPVVQATRHTPVPRVAKSAPAVKPAPTGYANCAAVRAAGKAPLHRGQAGYAPHLDRDNDGVACE